ncbi:DUF4387 domain-containing protein [Streptomyces fructofermentans]|uniref:DUF4387 domain-containing protein n=1 Tax=Streptomyces fructofermentans TaxID=152141 RepID=A0A918KJX8_9ACTN|nr:DUF4387 domain-containing protein [Streptomyces fructofermentans]GGX63808.1 hypothetical protein GCM10010515_34400 [Streptomyces fructofermentans]
MPERPDSPPLLGDYAIEVRSKNAGPFWVTMETFMRDSAGYAIAADEAFLNEDVIADLYKVDAALVQIYRIPALNVVKISFPRPVTQAGLRDRDIHAGQHHVPLAALRVPERHLTDDGGAEPRP